jgi:hypothetical protein
MHAEGVYGNIRDGNINIARALWRLQKAVDIPVGLEAPALVREGFLDEQVDHYDHPEQYRDWRIRLAGRGRRSLRRW